MTATVDNALPGLQRASAELQRQLDDARAELASNVIMDTQRFPDR